MSKKVRTRYAPSPTGFMHIGNLRTALYEYLIAKSNGGDFVLRIEDTDQERYVEGAEEVIYSTLKKVGLTHDEGPDVGGEYGPYVQSQRKDMYLPYAKKLVEEGKAYYCFCDKERLQSLKLKDGENEFGGYDRHCRNLSKEEIERKMKEGAPYVIRQKMPMEGTTTFHDMVFGEVTVENKELQDQILIKADGYPTYNFANVIDDHTMNITHVVRGCEYLSSTPKYNLLYEAFGWEIPTYIHLPLIMGKNEDGSVSKLSKRHGAVSFEELVKDGYLSEAIINYIALLGWCPEENKEIFSLEELCKEFSVKRISKSPSVFDYDKLNWFNAEYIRNMTVEDFGKIAAPYIEEGVGSKNLDSKKIASVLHERTVKLTDIPEVVKFFGKVSEYDKEMYINKKSKTNLENSLQMLESSKEMLNAVEDWSFNTLHDLLIKFAQDNGLKNGTVMWPIRIALSGQKMTPGGAIEILDILGKQESLNRIQAGIDKLKN